MNTKTELVTEVDKTPWLKQWTLNIVEFPEDKVEKISEHIRKSLETEHTAWYAGMY